jgi:hypothetical protein
MYGQVHIVHLDRIQNRGVVAGMRHLKDRIQEGDKHTKNRGEVRNTSFQGQNPEWV